MYAKHLKTPVTLFSKYSFTKRIFLNVESYLHHLTTYRYGVSTPLITTTEMNEIAIFQKQMNINRYTIT